MKSKIEHWFKWIFSKKYRVEFIDSSREELIKKWHANPMTFMQDCYGTTLPPFAGLRLNVAAKIMEIGDWRNRYDERRFS